MRRESLILGGIGAVTLIIVVVAAVLLSGPQSQSKNSTSKVTDMALLYGPEAERESTGTPSAKVTIVEFGDFQCPACGAVYPIVKKIKADYKDKIYFVFRNFPLPQHKNGAVSAEAAYAAGLQGKFWEMHDLLYGSQVEWGEKPEAQAKSLITGYGQTIGLDMDKFNESVSNNAGNTKIQKDQNDGYALGVDSTPTFFINGEKFAGVLSYDQFKKLIDDRLK
ncbi:MAG: thioredoxin domain-containing protein [Patescibacteria group bacterium]